MLGEHRKAEIITYEILEYFFENQAAAIQMAIDFSTEGVAIEVTGNLSGEPENLEQLATLLNIERNPDLEDYYDGLMGTAHELDDYALVGMLTDTAQVSYENQQLTIRLFRTI